MPGRVCISLDVMGGDFGAPVVVPAAVETVNEDPDVELVQVIHVRGPEAIDEARAVEPHVDTILLDSGTDQRVATE